MLSDPKKRKVLIRRADHLVQIVAFFVALLFIGGVILTLTSGDDDPASETPEHVLVFGGAPAQAQAVTTASAQIAPKDSDADEDDSDFGAFGEPMSEGHDKDMGGWGAAAKAAEKAQQ